MTAKTTVRTVKSDNGHGVDMPTIKSIAWTIDTSVGTTAETVNINDKSTFVRVSAPIDNEGLIYVRFWDTAAASDNSFDEVVLPWTEKDMGIPAGSNRTLSYIASSWASNTIVVNER